MELVFWGVMLAGSVWRSVRSEPADVMMLAAWLMLLLTALLGVSTSVGKLL